MNQESKLRQYSRSQDDAIQKALNILQEGLSEIKVFSKFPHLEEPFKRGLQANSILLMCDLSPFSEVTRNWPPNEIKNFLDHYYKEMVEIIKDNGGIIEKYIGDAILAVFGEPFEEKTTKDTVYNVLHAAQSLTTAVERAFSDEIQLKTAIAYGKCFFGYTGHEEHRELTIIGTPLTELFRLESECPPGGIILTSNLFNQIKDRFQIIPSYATSDFPIEWIISSQTLNLKGIGTVPVTILTRTEPII